MMMKINPFAFLISVFFSAILAYGLYRIAGPLATYVAIGGFAYFAGTLAPMTAIDFEYMRSGINLKALSGVFFVIGLALNSSFSLFFESATAYIVISALSFLLFLGLANAIHNMRQ
jgi:FtsH-binding integral membrane protein